MMKRNTMLAIALAVATLAGSSHTLLSAEQADQALLKAIGGAMQGVLMVAAYRFNIEGGHVPDVALMNKWYYPRRRELTRLGAKTPWLPALAERYGITNLQQLDYSYDL
jgi:hypothetical protein